MKNPAHIYFPILLLLFSDPSYAQLLSPAAEASRSQRPTTRHKEPHTSPQAALLSMDLHAGTTATELKEKYPIYSHATADDVVAMVAISDDFDRRAFRELGIQVNTDLGNLCSIQIPIQSYEAFINTPGIQYIELAHEVYPKLDKALAASNVDLVHNGTGLSQSYSGKDVVVGIIDFGFDYTHPTFSDPNSGELRIKRVWEQNTQSGSPPSGFAYGRELSGEQDILAAKVDLIQTGHGTHVASSGAGSGGSLSDLYRGVAYESDIVLVSPNAGDGTRINSTGVIDGINYIFQYAESVGKSAVVNVSQGHHTGPHDGSSLTDQAIDGLTGPGKIVVGAVGNEGDASGFYLHFDHNFDNENSILTYLVWPDEITAGSTIIEIWGEVGKPFSVGLEIFNPETQTMEARSETLHSDQPVSFLSGKLVDLEGDTLIYAGAIEINPLNNKPHAQFFVDNTSQSAIDEVNFQNLLDNDFIQLRFQSQAGTVHAYAANNSREAFFTDLSGVGADEFVGGTRVLGGNSRSTMGELGGTAHSIISVGGYTTKNEFQNDQGDRYTVEGKLGEQYLRSSQGPTLDGRIKPDISAPANLIAAAQNSFYEDIDESLVIDKISKGDGTDWKFDVRTGTSAAAPIVAGIIALMLEVDPNLTPESAKEFLSNHAKKDNFTGAVPNNIWGSGKVDALGAMSALEIPTSTTFLAAEQSRIFPNPTAGTFTLSSDMSGPIQIKVVDASGQVVLTKQVTKVNKEVPLQLPNVANGIYFLHLRHKGQMSQQKLMVLK